MNFPKKGGNPSGRAPRPPPPSMLADWANIDSESITGMMGTTLDLPCLPPPLPPSRPPTDRQHARTPHTTFTNLILPSPQQVVAHPPPPPPAPIPSVSPTPTVPYTSSGATPLPFMEGVGASTVMDWCTATQPIPPTHSVVSSSLTTPSPLTSILSRLGGDTVLVCDSLYISSVWGDSCLGAAMAPPPHQQSAPPQVPQQEREAHEDAPPSAPPPSPKESVVLGLSDGTGTVADGTDRLSLSPFDESIIASIVDRVGRTVVLDFIAAYGNRPPSVLTPVNPNVSSSSSSSSNSAPSFKHSIKTTDPTLLKTTQHQRTHQRNQPPSATEETTPPTGRLTTTATSPRKSTNNIRPNHRTCAYLNNGGKRPRDVDD